MVRFDIDTRNHYLDHGEQFIAAPQLEDLNIKDPEVYMARLKEITTPGEQMKQFALSVFNPSNFNITHEGRWTRNMALSGTFLGWFFGGMLDSRHLHEEYHRQHNASVFDHNYRAKRHMYDTFIFKIFRRGLGPGLKAGLLCLTTGFICFGSITYRGGRLFYPDWALGFATLGAVSRSWLGSRGLAGGAVLGLIGGSIGYATARSCEIVSGQTVAELRYMQEMDFARRREALRERCQRQRAGWVREQSG